MLSVKPFVSFAGRGQVTRDHLDSGLPSPTALLICSKESLALFYHVSFSSHSLTQFSPCSISHSSLTNKAELSTERGGAARWLCRADHHISLPVFCSFCLFPSLAIIIQPITFKSFSASLFIPGSHCYIGGIPRTLSVASVTAYGAAAAPGAPRAPASHSAWGCPQQGPLWCSSP